MAFKDIAAMDDAAIEKKVEELRKDILERRLNIKSEEKDTSVYRKKRKEIAQHLTALSQKRSQQ